MPGLSGGFDLFTASLLQGIASHVLDFDDTHLRTVVHPAGPVLSALWPLAEHHRANGARLLDALILGVEVECRVANALYPAHYDVGWHITGTVGVLGAAAASARLLGLDPMRTAHALGIAATQSSGFREMFGSMCKSLHVGVAARNGMQAALLAAGGFTSSQRAIEAPRGLAHVMSTGRDFRAITDRLGASWEIDHNTYKPFACGIVIHPAIDACIQLSRRHAVQAEDVAFIELIVHPLVLELTGTKVPASGLHGKFSVFHAAAAGYLRHKAGEAEFSDAAVREPGLVALRDRITAHVSATYREDEVHATVQTRDGRRFTLHIAHAIGSRDNPLSDAQLDAKFGDLAHPVLGEVAAADLLAAARDIEGADDIGPISALARPNS